MHAVLWELSQAGRHHSVGCVAMQDLETEIFLHLLQQHRSALNGLAEDAAAAAAKAMASSSDGMAPVRWLSLLQHQSFISAAS